MPIYLFTGQPGAGKSQMLAISLADTLWRNKKWFQKTGLKRQIWSNLKISPAVEKEYEGFIRYWTDPVELITLRDVDVFWDEIATHLDSTQWQNMPLEIKRWLQQHRKFGIEIFGTTQDFAMIDKSMRRMTSDLFFLSKLIGSRDKSSTKPPVKYIWGLVVIRTLDPMSYDEEKKLSKFFWPSFLWISRSKIDLFDTAQEIKMGKYPPLNHIERECCKPGCDFKKVVHA